MDRMRRVLTGTLIVFAVPLGMLVAIPLAVLLALAFHLFVSWQLFRSAARGVRALTRRLLPAPWPLEHAPPPTLALPQR
ncbi:MAG: hypothetical protein IT429_15545 [Gemmataceae bacterium]|nr:hypothetical protein [Gemmataceae bacterium]